MKEEATVIKYALSYRHSGAFILADLVGKYILARYGHAEGYPDSTPLESSLHANTVGFSPLIPTHAMESSSVEMFLTNLPESNLWIKRKAQDVLAACYLEEKLRKPDMTVDQFLDFGTHGALSEYIKWNNNLSGVNFAEVYSYEDLFEVPEQVLFKVLTRLKGHLNEDIIDLDIIDKVLLDSPMSEYGGADSVGISREVFNTVQHEHIKINLGTIRV